MAGALVYTASQHTSLTVANPMTFSMSIPNTIVYPYGNPLVFLVCLTNEAAAGWAFTFGSGTVQDALGNTLAPLNLSGISNNFLTWLRSGLSTSYAAIKVFNPGNPASGLLLNGGSISLTFTNPSIRAIFQPISADVFIYMAIVDTDITLPFTLSNIISGNGAGTSALTLDSRAQLASNPGASMIDYLSFVGAFVTPSNISTGVTWSNGTNILDTPDWIQSDNLTWASSALSVTDTLNFGTLTTINTGVTIVSNWDCTGDTSLTFQLQTLGFAASDTTYTINYKSTSGGSSTLLTTGTLANSTNSFPTTAVITVTLPAGANFLDVIFTPKSPATTTTAQVYKVWLQSATNMHYQFNHTYKAEPLASFETNNLTIPSNTPTLVFGGSAEYLLPFIIGNQPNFVAMVG